MKRKCTATGITLKDLKEIINSNIEQYGEDTRVFVEYPGPCGEPYLLGTRCVKHESMGENKIFVLSTLVDGEICISIDDLPLDEKTRSAILNKELSNEELLDVFQKAIHKVFPDLSLIKEIP